VVALRFIFSVRRSLGLYIKTATVITTKGFLRKADKESLRRQTQQYLNFIRAALVCIQVKNTCKRLTVQENTLRQARKRLSRDSGFLFILFLSSVSHVHKTYHVIAVFFLFYPYPLSVTCTRPITWWRFSFHPIPILCRSHTQDLSRDSGFLSILSLSQTYHVMAVFFLSHPMSVTCGGVGT
jgi:hypothetical protein